MASTKLNELGYRTDVIELQLAHTQSNTVRAVYNRNEHLEERRTMMQDWSDYLTTLKGTAPSTNNSNSVNESMEQYRKSKRKTFE